jgi:hypothetical protein
VDAEEAEADAAEDLEAGGSQLAADADDASAEADEDGAS